MDTRKKGGIPQFRWADEIVGFQEGDNLLVFGYRRTWEPADLLTAYKQGVDPPPHLQFANCDTDAKLIAFVGEFGPVHGTSAMSTMLECPAGTSDKILDEASVAYEARATAIGASKRVEPMNRRQAIIERKTAAGHFSEEVERVSVKYRRPFERRGIVQNLGELRTEQTLLKATIALMGRLVNPVPRTPAGTKEIDDLVGLLQALPEGTKHWAAQLEKEQAELRSEYDVAVPEWHWSPADQSYLEGLAISASGAVSRRSSPGHSSSASILLPDPHTLSRSALILLLNAFPFSLQWHGNAPIEVPPDQLLHGIRPLLFAMLRWDLLHERQIRMCIREGCSDYFVASRSDKDCCSTRCSVVAASKKRYDNIVKPAREKARKRSQDGAATTSKRKEQRRSANASMHLGGSE
jgi:hypothetical protein